MVAKLPPKPKKHKAEMSVGESFAFLAKSSYIRDLAALVCRNIPFRSRQRLSPQPVMTDI